MPRPPSPVLLVKKSFTLEDGVVKTLDAHRGLTSASAYANNILKGSLNPPRFTKK